MVGSSCTLPKAKDTAVRLARYASDTWVCYPCRHLQTPADTALIPACSIIRVPPSSSRLQQTGEPKLKMKVSLTILACTAGPLLAQGFEPADFNVTEALLKNGVAACALPQPSELDDRSPLSGCKAAVGLQ